MGEVDKMNIGMEAVVEVDVDINLVNILRTDLLKMLTLYAG